MADFADRVAVKDGQGNVTIQLEAALDEKIPLPTGNTVTVRSADVHVGGHGAAGRLRLDDETGHEGIRARSARGGELMLYDKDGKLTLLLDGRHGVIHVRDWTIEAPDYVFEESYPLRPLSEVAEYVGRERHLPGVPSAAAIAENGVDVTRLLIALLEKVEELTLYAIAQQREIDELKARVG